MSIFDDIVAAIDNLGQVAKIEMGEAALTSMMKQPMARNYFAWDNGLGTTPSRLMGWPFEYRPYLEGWRVIGVVNKTASYAEFIQSDDFNEVQANRYARHKNRTVQNMPVEAKPEEKFLLLFWTPTLEEWVPHSSLLDSEREAKFTASNLLVANRGYFDKTKIVPLGVLDNG